MQKLANDAENQLIYLFKSPKNLETFIAENPNYTKLTFYVPKSFRNVPLAIYLYKLFTSSQQFGECR